MLSRHLKYIHELEAGPKTTRDMMLSLRVTGASVARMMQKLRAAKVVKSERVAGVPGNIWQHKLIPGYEQILEAESHAQISKELMFVADLSDQSCVGQRLTAEHAKYFPARNKSGMRYLVAIARKQGLCR